MTEPPREMMPVQPMRIEPTTIPTQHQSAVRCRGCAGTGRHRSAMLKRLHCGPAVQVGAAPLTRLTRRTFDRDLLRARD